MKRMSFMGAVALGALLVVFAGVSQATYAGAQRSGDVLEHWGPVETGSMPDSGATGNVLKFEALNPAYEPSDTKEHWGPVETGSLPGAGKKGRLIDTGVDPSRWEEPDGGG